MNIKPSKEWAMFYGILIGDGCISQYKKWRYISITCNIYDDKPFFNEVVIPLVKKLRMKNTPYRERKKYGKIEINFSDVTFFEKIKSLDFPVGKKGQIKISEQFPDNLWKYIIAGIFATDGSLVVKNNNNTIYPRLEITSISGELLHQIKEFLMSRGFKGNVYKNKRNDFVPTYRLEFPGKNNVLNFRDEIGFINPKHREKLKTYLEKRHLPWNRWVWN